MSPHTQKDASFASNKLTRNVKLPGHLLSTFNKENSPPKDKPSPKTDTDSSLSQIGTETEAELEREQIEEDISIYAAPASSTEEEIDDSESDIERPRRFNREPIQRLEDRLATGKAARRESGGQSVFPKKALARTSSMKDDDDDDLMNWSFQSQSSKRSRNTFGSRKSQSFSRAPTSSAISIATPEKPSPKPKPAAKTKKVKNKKKESKSPEESEPEDTFKVPINIDVPSPVKTKSESKIPPSPQFKVPLMFPDDEPSYSSSVGASQFKSFEISSQSSLSSLSTPSSPSFNDELQKLPEFDPEIQICSPDPSSPPRKSLCPNCKAEVDPELLMEFQAQPDQRLRQQQRFCASHKRDMATKEWKDQGFPEINWDTLGERLQGYFPDLEKYFNSDEPSYFRNLLESTQKAGKTLRLTLEGEGIEVISCGYYGTKGSQKM